MYCMQRTLLPYMIKLTVCNVPFWLVQSNNSSCMQHDLLLHTTNSVCNVSFCLTQTHCMQYSLFPLTIKDILCNVPYCLKQSKTFYAMYPIASNNQRHCMQCTLLSQTIKTHSMQCTLLPQTIKHIVCNVPYCLKQSNT